MIRLVAFLGNFGTHYADTRHNVAWLFADALSVFSSLSWQKKFKGQYAVASVLCADGSIPKGSDDGKVYVLKPETYMNLSGESIAPLAHFYKIKPEEILVIHDELEIPCGTVSLKWSGGLGGHNGLRSTKATLGTADFWRLRIGIGRPDHSDISAYVLSSFSSDESIKLSQIFPPLADFFMQLLLTKPENCITEWGKKNLLP